MLPPGSFLVTLDVSSLCTNIPHDEGIVACEEALNSRESPVPLTDDLCHLIRLILLLNSFTFNKKKTLFSNSRYCHGYPYGSILCKLVHEEVGTGVPINPEQEMSSVMEVYFCHMDP